MSADVASLLLAPPRGALLSVLIDAPVAPPDAFLRLPLPGDPLLWDARSWGEPWALAGRGAAAAAEGRGASRFSQVEREARGWLAGVEVRAAPSVAAEPPRFFGGASFDADAAPSADWADFGDARFVVPRWGYELRATRASLRLTLRPEELGDPGRWAEEARFILQNLEKPAATRRAPRGLPPSPRGDRGQAYVEAVAAAVAAIEAGGFEKLVVARAQAVELPADLDPWAIFGGFQGALARFAFGRAGRLFCGATPERLVALEGQRLRSEAVAGTIADAQPGAPGALLASGKDRREHELVTAAILEALGPCCDEVQAAATEVRPLRHLLHLVTPIQGRTRAGVHALELVRALHPTPAVGGVPREDAARWLRQREGLDRGWYAGPVGWFDARGGGQFAVALRSALLAGQTGRLFAGAGVVAGSDPAAELRETEVKLRAMIEALTGAT